MVGSLRLARFLPVVGVAASTWIRIGAEGNAATASIMALVAVLGAIGFTVERENSRFLTCYDFSVAGTAEPDNCVR